MAALDSWRLRARTLEAIALLVAAWVLVALVPMRRWRGRLGCAAAEPDPPQEALRLARHVERGAGRLPLGTKCLPRAMALSWMLRRRRIGHRLVIAVRPAGQRGSEDHALHAWVASAGHTVIGDLPGPWHELLSLP